MNRRELLWASAAVAAAFPLGAAASAPVEAPLLLYDERFVEGQGLAACIRMAGGACEATGGDIGAVLYGRSSPASRGRPLAFLGSYAEAGVLVGAAAEQRRPIQLWLLHDAQPQGAIRHRSLIPGVDEDRIRLLDAAGGDWLSALPAIIGIGGGFRPGSSPAQTRRTLSTVVLGPSAVGL